MKEDTLEEGALLKGEVCLREGKHGTVRKRVAFAVF